MPEHALEEELLDLRQQIAWLCLRHDQISCKLAALGAAQRQDRPGWPIRRLSHDVTLHAHSG